MRIFIRKGKGRRDRYVLLPEATLELPREYRPEQRPKDWLFAAPGTGGQYHTRTVQDAFKSALKKSKVQKYGTIHTLRHCFATRLSEDGDDLYSIRKLLGHANILTTFDGDFRQIRKPAFLN